MEKQLWRFTDNLGSFEFPAAHKIKALYFPLANENILSAISPDLHGDIKTGQDSFLLQPVSRIDLVNLRSSRNFWIYLNENKIWSATGVSKNLAQIEKDNFHLEAGLLWHRVTRENKKIGLKAEILSFVPATGEQVEIMQVRITNVTNRRIKFIPTAAIPVYARGANNLRDHRHVTSLLNRARLNKYGVFIKPTLLFDENGHKPNATTYFIIGWDERNRLPKYLYPTQEMFCGEEGDLEAPESIFKNLLPDKNSPFQGREAMGALRFAPVALSAGKSRTYIILMGVIKEKNKIKNIIHRFNSPDKVKTALEKTREFWIDISRQTNLITGDTDFDNWFRWVSIQPTFRRIFGCSFLPDFDYGKGGRGWRDLWQDCLSLILSNPASVGNLLINNFSGVRIDGSNATIIGKKPGEFIADRNDIARVWMDHGAWPLLTLDLYINETADLDILFKETAYFRDQHIFRSRLCDKNWNLGQGNKLKTVGGKIYQGTILEHLLVENLVQFFNVGEHNHVRLEGADWNDGLDMAKERGESVAFSAMYAQNLACLSELLFKTKMPAVKIARELKILLKKIDYHNIKAKQEVLDKYFQQTKDTISGRKISVNTKELARDLNAKADWMRQYIRRKEWIKNGFFNGYYNNAGERVEGIKKGGLRMCLASQVFAIMSGVAEERQIKKIFTSCQKYLCDKQLKGYHLNTDSKAEEYNLGRAFSFVYGDKENGAFFNHMVVMFAYALYKRGLVKKGWIVLSSIYNMAADTHKSKIYPCLPEYFNLQGRGMYAYLTGSASWFILTLLTQALGIKGKDGDLLIEPKLIAAQFHGSSSICIQRVFAGRKIKIIFSNPKKLGWLKYKIIRITLNSRPLPITNPLSTVIPRRTILDLPSHRQNSLNVILG